MREENFGPIMNPDGSPTEITLQMMSVTSPWDERNRYLNRQRELHAAITSDFDKFFSESSDKRGLILEASRQCIVEMQQLQTQINRVDDIIWDWMKEHTETKGNHFGMTETGSSASTNCPLCNGDIS